MAGNNITTGGDTSLGGDVDGADLVFGGSTLSIDSDTILRSTTDSINFPASVVGTGALAIDPTDGQDMVISNSGGGTTGIIEANVFTGFQGHLIIGGTTTPLSSTPLLADSFDVSAAFIDVQVPLVSSGPITLLAGGINLAAGTPDNSHQCRWSRRQPRKFDRSRPVIYCHSEQPQCDGGYHHQWGCHHRRWRGPVCGPGFHQRLQPDQPAVGPGTGIRGDRHGVIYGGSVQPSFIGQQW